MNLFSTNRTKKSRVASEEELTKRSLAVIDLGDPIGVESNEVEPLIQEVSRKMSINMGKNVALDCSLIKWYSKTNYCQGQSNPGSTQLQGLRCRPERKKESTWCWTKSGLTFSIVMLTLIWLRASSSRSKVVQVLPSLSVVTPLRMISNPGTSIDSTPCLPPRKTVQPKLIIFSLISKSSIAINCHHSQLL